MNGLPVFTKKKQKSFAEYADTDFLDHSFCPSEIRIYKISTMKAKFVTYVN